MPVQSRESHDPLPKTAGPGSLHLEWKRCGRRNCRCADGMILHGPYAAHYWRENGIQRKRYVPMANVGKVLQMIEELHDEHEHLSEVRKLLGELGNAISL